MSKASTPEMKRSVIELGKPRRRLWLSCLKLIAFVAVFSVISVYYSSFIKNLGEKARREAVVGWLKLGSYMRPDLGSADEGETPRGLKDMVDHYSLKYGMNSAVAWAVIDQESNGHSDRVRFEQTWKDQYAKKWRRESWMTETEWNMMFSSIGLMQVGYGIHKQTCGLKSFAELFDAGRNLDCGLFIISECLTRNGDIKAPGARLRQCFKEYNGSGPRAEAYANDVMAKLADFMLEQPAQTVVQISMAPKGGHQKLE